LYNLYTILEKKETSMDEFDKKIKEALNEVANGFEASDDMKKRIDENINKKENEMIVGKDTK